MKSLHEVEFHGEGVTEVRRKGGSRLLGRRLGKERLVVDGGEVEWEVGEENQRKSLQGMLEKGGRYH